MTPRQRQARLRLIQHCAERTESACPQTASDDEVIAQARDRTATSVGRWLAYHRGLSGYDKEPMPMSRR